MNLNMHMDVPEVVIEETLNTRLPHLALMLYLTADPTFNSVNQKTPTHIW